MNQNLEHIARLAGVSRSTVSRVINNHPNVKPETRARVQAIIREQNFRPNAAARTLVTQESNVLSLVIPQAVASTFTDPYFPMLIQSITAKANELDYALMLWIGNSNEMADRFAQRVLENSLFGGLLIAAAVNNDPLIPYLVNVQIPFLIIGPPPLPELNFIDVDNLGAARAAVSHLIDMGWKRIGTITGPLNMGAAAARLDGYRLALQEAGLTVDEALIVEGRFDEPSGYEAMNALLQQQVDAVFVASDMMAFGALRAIHEAGLRVPEDIGIVGFDDLPASASSTPPLTTVRQPIQEVGSLATQMLADLLQGRAEPPYQKILPATLVVRQSSGSNSFRWSSGGGVDSH
ncbi:MAG: LacI family DNA-binding transcriptional regulator [Chloroflexota bacterium]|nr:MAG: LacI family transcriptional regulator [Chloroflexota bacterium]